MHTEQTLRMFAAMDYSREIAQAKIAPETIMHQGSLYIRQDLTGDQVRRLEAEIEGLEKLLHTYRQAVFEVKERMSKLDADQKSWLESV